MGAFKEYVVGEFYEVPCVRVGEVIPAGARKGSWIPVLLPFHDDVEIFNLPILHYHYDLRFIGENLYRHFRFGLILSEYPYSYWSEEESAIASDTRKAFFTGGIVYRRLKCRRPMPVFTLSESPNEDLVRRLEAAYVHDHLRNGVCPHKGIDLTGCPVVDGVVTCPGHGLRWHVETGKLVRQFPEIAYKLSSEKI